MSLAADRAPSDRIRDMDGGPEPHEGISKIVPYVPGWSKLASGAPAIKLASNESAIGPSPRAVQAAREALERCSLYEDPPSLALRSALSDHHGVDRERIFVGAGSEDIIRLLACAYCSTGDAVVYTEHGFQAYPISARVAGADTIVARERELRVDVDAVASAIRPEAKIVYLANPGNPTGTYISRDELARLRSQLPPDVLLVVDAAYAEYARKEDYSTGAELVGDARAPVAVLRTFSKAYGLASLRVGWAYAPASVVDVLDKVRDQFNVSGPARAAAIAALSDLEHLGRALSHNDAHLPWLEARLRRHGLVCPESVANFVLARVPGGVSEAEALVVKLLESGISVKPGAVGGVPDAVRVTIGPREHLEHFLEALDVFYAERAR